MARVKKTQALTAAEKLEQTLVPKSEHPYMIPENWVWTQLGCICEVQNGPNFSGLSFPYLDVKTLRGNKDFVFKSEGALVLPGSRVILVDGENSGEVFLINTEGYLGSTLRLLDFAAPNNAQYIEYFIAQHKEQLKKNKKGSAIPHLNKEIFYALSFPLPPLPEQHRIVARIESLFEKLDHARELVQSALDSFESRKATILHKAFAGELTAKWREKNGVKLESWEYKQLEEVCISIYDGDHMAPPKREFGIPFLVISNINKGYVTFEETRFVPEDYYNSLSETRTPQEGDLLYSIVGSFGIPAIVKENIKFCFQRHIALLRPDTKYLNYKCFWYIMQTQEVFNQVDSIATGTAQRTVPIRGLRKISFSFPSLLEQQEIVRTLDSLLEKEQHAKDKLEPILDHIALIKKSILARAFRGELGTNDPSEENAIELLKEVLE